MSQNIVPPYDIDAERSVLASIMLDRDALIKAAELLAADDFYDPAHQMIYECCMELFDLSSAVDIVTVKAHLTNNGNIKKVGGIKYLSDLISILPLTTNIEYYSKIIREASLRRKIISSSADLVGLGMDESKKLDEIIDEIERKVFAISQKTQTKSLVHLRDVLMESTERYEELQKGGGTLRGISTGFKHLDNLLGGFHSGDLIILAARPGVGKTSFLLALARHMSVSVKKKVLIFSLEMGRDQLADRLISLEGDVDLMSLRMGSLQGEEFKRYIDAMGVLHEADIYIDDTPGLHISELRSKCRKWDLEIGIDIVFVDYLQLLHGKATDNRAQEVSQISQSLKQIARELKVPVVALSQLNRAIESRADRRPQLSDLRESGSIEQDADMVIFLHREAIYKPDDEAERDKAQVIVAKHRNGATGIIDARFIPERAKYVDWE